MNNTNTLVTPITFDVVPNEMVKKLFRAIVNILEFITR